MFLLVAVRMERLSHNLNRVDDVRLNRDGDVVIDTLDRGEQDVGSRFEVADDEVFGEMFVGDGHVVGVAEVSPSGAVFEAILWRVGNSDDGDALPRSAVGVEQATSQNGATGCRLQPKQWIARVEVVVDADTYLKMEVAYSGCAAKADLGNLFATTHAITFFDVDVEDMTVEGVDRLSLPLVVVFDDNELAEPIAAPAKALVQVIASGDDGAISHSKDWCAEVFADIDAVVQ